MQDEINSNTLQGKSQTKSETKPEKKSTTETHEQIRSKVSMKTDKKTWTIAGDLPNYYANNPKIPEPAFFISSAIEPYDFSDRRENAS